MSPREFMLYSYVILGLFFVLFNKFVGSWVYKFVLLFADRIKIKDLFLFKVDSSNRDSFFFLTRSFAAIFGVFLVASALYYFG